MVSGGGKKSTSDGVSAGKNLQATVLSASLASDAMMLIGDCLVPAYACVRAGVCERESVWTCVQRNSKRRAAGTR